jgi:uncharacterized repeat protein (TIGR01451 family)
MKQKIYLAATIALSLVFTISIVTAVQAGSNSIKSVARPLTQSTDTPTLRPIVVQAEQHDTSPALRDLARLSAQSSVTTSRALPFFALPHFSSGLPPLSPQQIDRVVQTQAPQASSISVLNNFEGINNVNGVYPPDTQGDIGYDPSTGKKYYIQWVNLSYAIWDVTVTPTLIVGPVAGNTLWSGFGGDCQTTNDGDPITLFDPIAQRWLMSQFAFQSSGSSAIPPFYQCIAISATGDPTGAWHRYAFRWQDGSGLDTFNDYGKFGVWPDGYYFTTNQFSSKPEEGLAANQPNAVAAWKGAGAAAFDRVSMLNGLTATLIYFDLYPVNPNLGGMLPADFDGTNLPPANSPNYFAEVDNLSPADLLRIWKFHADWTTPANSTFGLNGAANYTLTVESYASLPCTLIDSSSCIPQPGTSTKLDSVADRLMYRLAYRNFGDHEALVVNHTVLADGVDRAGVRWYEVRDLSGSPSIYQQGTFAPADGLYRWMGSAAMDHVGNLALGYSVGSGSLYPSIRVTGRLATDITGTLPQGEAVIITGTGAQTGQTTSGGGRWGDYSLLSIDPVDDCTFWYTQEYIQTTGIANWRTRIASFKFPGCALEAGTLTGLITDAVTTAPISDALVSAISGNFSNLSNFTDATGRYAIGVPSGIYTVSAHAYGYLPLSINNITISSNLTTTQNFALNPAPLHVISGTVIDANTGWPLYARLLISGNPIDPPSPNNDRWTDPVSGFYSLTLPESFSATIKASAWVAGYTSANINLTIAADATQDISLTANALTCSAPGYQFTDNSLYQDFESWPPANWSIVDNITGTSLIWNLDSAYGDSNYTSGSGHAATVDSDANKGVPYDTELRSPLLNLSNFTATLLTYQLNYQDWNTQDFLDVDISPDGGTNWTNLRHFTTNQGSLNSAPGVIDTIDLSAYAAQTNVQLRWHYYSTSATPWDWYAQIDEVRLGGQPVCQPPAGGLVVGHTYNAADSTPLPGARVSTASGRSFTSTATLDPQTDDSFYTLFSPAGTQVFTASLYNFAPAVTSTNVVSGSTSRQDFYLSNAPDLIISKFGPAWARPGDLISYTLIYTNIGYYTATNLLLTDTLPGGITSNLLTNWSFSDQPIGVGGSIVFTATLDNSLIGGTLLTNTVIIESDNSEVNLSNNSAYSTLAVCTSIDSLDFTFEPPVPSPLQTINFSAVLTGGSLPITYAWDFGDGNFGAEPFISHAFALTTSTQIYTTTLAVSNICSALNVGRVFMLVPKLLYLPIVLKDS